MDSLKGYLIYMVLLHLILTLLALTLFETMLTDMHMMRKRLKIRKKLGGSTYMVMYLGTLRTSLSLLHVLALALSSLLCKSCNPFSGKFFFLFLFLFCFIGTMSWFTLHSNILSFFCSAIFIFILALVGVFYPYNRGALFTALVVIYALTSGIAGYVATNYYCQLEGTNWVSCTNCPTWCR
jgi:Endomembrane protein 70